MTRLPVPGQDENMWGTLLNDFLSTSHNADGTIKPAAVTGSTISDNTITLGKLATSNTPGSGQLLSYNGTDLAWATAPVTSVNSHVGAVTVTKSDVGLANVDNTADVDKPVSTATQTALNLKADASAVGAKILLIDNAAALPAGTPAGVIVVVKS